MAQTTRTGAGQINGRAKEVYFDEKKSYKIKLDGYPNDINDGLSMAAKKVAELGSGDRNEHMYLVSLSDGTLAYYETNGIPDQVGIKFWEYAKEHKEETFAFVHNHNVESSLSESDLETPVILQNVPMQIAVQNNGVIYIAKRTKDAINKYYPDDYFEKELEMLNRMSRDGIITPIERMNKREEIITNALIDEFYKEGVIKIDG